jgi:hypothetical protein
MEGGGRPDYYKPANEALVLRLPELRASYDEVTASWGEEMGPHIIYNEILNPYLTRLLESDDEASEVDLRRVFGVLEELLVGDDTYAADAVATTVGEYLESDRELLQRARLFMGPRMSEQTRDRLPYRLPRRLRPKSPWRR